MKKWNVIAALLVKEEEKAVDDFIADSSKGSPAGNSVQLAGCHEYTRMGGGRT